MYERASDMMVTHMRAFTKGWRAATADVWDEEMTLSEQDDIHIATFGRLNRHEGCMELVMTRFPMAARLEALVRDARTVLLSSDKATAKTGKSVAADMRLWGMPEQRPHEDGWELCVYRFYRPHAMLMLKIHLRVARSLVVAGQTQPRLPVVSIKQIRAQHDLQMLDCVMRTVEDLLRHHTTEDEAESVCG